MLQTKLKPDHLLTEMATSNQSTCLNCGENVVANYCSNCGQSTHVSRITFRETINDFFSSTFALEGPLLSTIKLLITNPGALFRDFLAGRRKSYYKPVAFFVVLTALYLITRDVINYDPFHGQPQMKSDNIPERAKLFVLAGRFMVANINNIMFFLVLSIGLSQKLFFRKYYLAEYIVMGFFISGIYLIIGIIHMLFSVYVFYVTAQIMLALLFLYMIYAVLSFHRKYSFFTVFKSILACLLSILLYVFFGFGFSVLIVYYSQ